MIAAIAMASACSNSAPLSSTAGGQAESATPSPPPFYSINAAKKGLLPPNEIEAGLKESSGLADTARDGHVPICSLSRIQLKGQPEIIARQFQKNTKVQGSFFYIQVIARYADSQEAGLAFEALRNRARSCPSKREIEAKKTGKDTTRLPHRDNWKTREDTVSKWSHIRGLEKQVYSASSTKFNIFHVIYDYASRGNLVLTTLYLQRTEPGEASKPIIKKAREVLTKQLRKFG